MHSCAADRTTRNRCAFQLLSLYPYTTLFRSRLSVGRIHKQQFHHLRTRLSEFERRKRDQLPRDRVKCADALLLPSASLQWVRYKRQIGRASCREGVLASGGVERTTERRED